MKVYTREIYLNKIKPFIGKQLIKVLTGQRRVGKSFLLLQLIDLIKNQYPESNIIHIDKENNDFGYMKNHIDLDIFVKQVISFFEVL